MLLLLCSGSMMLSLLLLEQLRTSVPNAYNERRYDFTVKNKKSEHTRTRVERTNGFI